nr:hypothetical protein [Tanacetum cinerariifolium]
MPLWLIPHFMMIMDRVVRLQNFIKVVNPFDVVCGGEKLLENKRPILKKTTDVVTPHSDEIVNLGPVPLLPLFLLRLILGRERRETPSPLLLDDPPPATAPKAREFVFVVSTAPQKRLYVQGKKSMVYKKPISKKSQLVLKLPKSIVGECAIGSSYKATDYMRSLEVGSKQLVFKGSLGGKRTDQSSNTLTFLSSASTHSEPLVSARPRPRSTHVSDHISRILFDPVYTSMGVDPSMAKDINHPDWELTNDFIINNGYYVAALLIVLLLQASLHASGLILMRHRIERLRKRLNEKPSREMARLRLGFESVESDVGRLRKQVEELKVEAGKVPGLLALYSQKETDLSTINGKYQDLLREKKQLELYNASLRGQVDGETKVKPKLARMLDAQQRRFDEQVAILDRRLDKMVKETDRLGACISIVVAGVRLGLEAGIVHGRKGTDINSILSNNPDVVEVYSDALNALNDVTFPLLEQLEACAGEQFSLLKLC